MTLVCVPFGFMGENILFLGGTDVFTFKNVNSIVLRLLILEGESISCMTSFQCQVCL